MPCIKCPNGKWKYGEKGKCQFKTLKACNAASAAIHADKKEENAEHKSRDNNKKNL